MDRENELVIFRQRFQSDWTLHAFRHSVWLVEYLFDDTGPSDLEFEVVFGLVGDYWGERRTDLQRRLADCSGFRLGRPYSKAEVDYLRRMGIRTDVTEVEPGSRHIHTGQRYYHFSDAGLRELAAVWMTAQGIVVEWRDGLG